MPTNRITTSAATNTAVMVSRDLPSISSSPAAKDPDAGINRADIPDAGAGGLASIDVSLPGRWRDLAPSLGRFTMAGTYPLFAGAYPTAIQSAAPLSAPRQTAPMRGAAPR